MGTAIGGLCVKDQISLEFLSNKVIGIDAHNILYQFLSSIRGPDGTPLMNSEGNVTSHLTGLFYRTINLLEKKARPVFVFDGKPLELKSKTLAERIRIRTEAEYKHELALKQGNLEDAKKFGSRALKLSFEMIEEAKLLLDLLGLPVITAIHDAEAQLAGMAFNKKIFGCSSQDYDSLLFGAPVVFRNIAVSGKRKIPGKNFYVDVFPKKIELEKTLLSLGISRKKLVWIGILIGTDFNEKFPNIGPKKALGLVKKHDSFEGILKETKIEPFFDFSEIEQIFLNPDYLPDFSLEFKPIQKEKVVDFLCSRHGFNVQRVESALKKISDTGTVPDSSQSSLKKWFS